MQRAFTIFAVLLSTTALAAEPSRSISDEQWTDDLQQLATAIREQHFKPFHEVAEQDFNTAVAALGDDLPTLAEAEIIIRMAQIVALLGDGHTRLHLPRLYPELALRAELGHSGTRPPNFDSLRLRQLPVRFGLFDNGLFVVAATEQNMDLIGQRVLAFDETPAADALERVKAVSFFENESRARLMAPDRLALPDVLHVMGISESAEQVLLSTGPGKPGAITTTIRSLDVAGEEFVEWTCDSGPPRWLKRKDEYRWYEVLPDENAIYVQVNEFEENPVTPYGDFVAETIAAAEEASVQRFVIDLRHNFGGIGTWVTPFVTGLAGSDFNDYGRLYVLMGRMTFSAAQQFIHKFEELSYAIFVGEPSGARPSHFGDAKRVILDNSGLTLRVSTIYWHSWLANDFRDAVNPHIPATMSSGDYPCKDPVLAAALQYQAPPTLAAQIEEQFRLGHNQNALILFQRYLTDGTVVDHRREIPGLLEMAERIVEDGLERQGYFVYFLANLAYPGDPQVESRLAELGELVNR